MKKLLIGLFAVLSLSLFSCKNKYSDQIKTFVETKDNVITDLHFKLIHLDELSPTYAKDMIPTFESELQMDIAKELDRNTVHLRNLIDDDDALIYLRKEIDSLSAYSSKVNDCIGSKDLKKIKSLNSNNLTPQVEMIEKLKSNPSQLMGYHAKCTYSIINPLIGNARQEITKVFAFDTNKVIQGESYFKF